LPGWQDLCNLWELSWIFMVTLTQYIQKRLGEAINQIDVQVEYITSWRMKAKAVEDEDEEIPF
jgi:hypothetical protein